MPNNLFASAPIICVNNDCELCKKAVEILHFDIDEVDKTYSKYLLQEIQATVICDCCKRPTLLDEPYKYLFAQVEKDNIIFTFKLQFTKEQIDLLMRLHKNTVEDNRKGSMIFLASDEAFRLTDCYEVYAEEPYLEDTDALYLPNESTLENRNKVVIAKSNGICLQSDVLVADKYITVTSATFTIKDMFALYSYFPQEDYATDDSEDLLEEQP